MKEKEKKIIKEALLLEQEGYDFYMLSAERYQDENVKEAFKKIAEEEQKHMDWLKRLYRKMEGDENATLKLEDPPESPNIFTKKRTKPLTGSLAVSVFGISVKMEKAAVDYYTEAAASTEIEEAKELYDTLIEWEKEHLNDFQSQYEMLQQDWWNEQHFAPF